MSQISFKPDLSQLDLLEGIDVAALNSEEEIRAAAAAQLPTALTMIGRALAESAWESTQKLFKGPYFKPNKSHSDKEKYIKGTAQAYVSGVDDTIRENVVGYMIGKIVESKAAKSAGETQGG